MKLHELFCYRCLAKIERYLALMDEPDTMEDCAVCLGEGRVPVFEDRDGVYTAVGYRPWDCVAEG
jgi:hypothetical protein